MSAPTVVELAIHRPQRFVWLKAVTGADLTQHCARSLAGPYVEPLRPAAGATLLNHYGRLPEPLNLPEQLIPPRAWYLCAVDEHYRHPLNSHLAFTYAPGEWIDADLPGLTVHIADARQLPFDETDIAADDPNARRREYATCRNWQFAHALTNGRWADL